VSARPAAGHNGSSNGGNGGFTPSQPAPRQTQQGSFDDDDLDVPDFLK
jgi:hypothetical protein